RVRPRLRVLRRRAASDARAGQRPRRGPTRLAAIPAGGGSRALRHPPRTSGGIRRGAPPRPRLHGATSARDELTPDFAVRMLRRPDVDVRPAAADRLGLRGAQLNRARLIVAARAAQKEEPRSYLSARAYTDDRRNDRPREFRNAQMP